MQILALLAKLQWFLKGKKTYLIASGSIIAVIVGWSDGTISTPSMVEQLIGLILAITIRQGVTHEITKATETVKKNVQSIQTSSQTENAEDIKINFK